MSSHCSAFTRIGASEATTKYLSNNKEHSSFKADRMTDLIKRQVIYITASNIFLEIWEGKLRCEIERMFVYLR